MAEDHRALVIDMVRPELQLMVDKQNATWRTGMLDGGGASLIGAREAPPFFFKEGRISGPIASNDLVGWSALLRLPNGTLNKPAGRGAGRLNDAAENRVSRRSSRRDHVPNIVLTSEWI
jgi:hypothetical protein